MATTERNSNELLDSAFERLSRRERGWEDRPGQREMARLWSETLELGGALVVEAPTGIGKSLAYLLPALLRRARGSGPVVVSTCTKALQDQLFRRDVPLACRAMGIPLRVVTLKGRQNYLCRRRAEARLDQRSLFAPSGLDEEALSVLRAWTERTTTGELEELAELGIYLPPAFLAEIASDPLLCSASACEAATGCFAKRARREALRADVVLVNHALLLSDPGLRATLLAAHPRHGPHAAQPLRPRRAPRGARLALSLARGSGRCRGAGRGGRAETRGTRNTRRSPRALARVDRSGARASVRRRARGERLRVLPRPRRPRSAETQPPPRARGSRVTPESLPGLRPHAPHFGDASGGGGFRPGARG